MLSKQEEMLDAAKEGDIEDVKILLNDESVDINKQDSTGHSALLWASLRGHRDIVELLLDRGADIEARTSDWNSTPLIWCSCLHQHTSIVELLLDRGANIHAVNKYGAGALHHACEEGHDAVVKLLLKHGANTNACNVYKHNPLHLACYYGHLKCVQALLRHDMEDVKDKGGITPFDCIEGINDCAGRIKFYGGVHGGVHEGAGIVNILKEHMKALQKRKDDEAGITHDSKDSITSEKVSSAPKKKDEENSNKVQRNTTTTHDLELKIKASEESHRNEVTSLKKKLQALEEKIVPQSEVEKKIQEMLEAQKHSQCNTTSEVTSNFVKIQEVLEKQFNNQQALVEKTMTFLEQKLDSKDQQIQTFSQCSLEATTDALKKNIQELDQKSEVALEEKLDSKIHDAMEQQYERLSERLSISLKEKIDNGCNTSSSKRMGLDNDIEGPNSKRLKVTDDDNEGTKMMNLEKGVVTIQQSMERIERKSFRKDIILIGLGGALKFIFGSSR